MEVVDQVDFEAFAGEWLETIKKGMLCSTNKYE